MSNIFVKAVVLWKLFWQALVDLRLCVCLHLQVCMTQTRPWVGSWIFLKEEPKDSSPTSKTLPPKSSSRWPGERCIQPAVKHPCGCPTLTSAHVLLQCVLACPGFVMMHHFPPSHWQIQPNEGRGRSGGESTSNRLAVNLKSLNLAHKQCHQLLSFSMFSSFCAQSINRFRGSFSWACSILRHQGHNVVTWRRFQMLGRIIMLASSPGQILQ